MKVVFINSGGVMDESQGSGYVRNPWSLFSEEEFAMTMRISKTLFFLIAVLALISLGPSNNLHAQAQPGSRTTSSTDLDSPLTEPDLQPVPFGILQSSPLTPTTQATEEMSASDASGNGASESSAEPSKYVENGTAKLVFSCASPVSGNGGLTWDGHFLWIADWNTRRAYRVDPSNCLAVSSIPLPGTYPTGLAWDGSHLWHADGNAETIYQLDPTTGNILYSFSSPGGFPTGLTWDGSRLWNSDTNCSFDYCTPDRVHKLTPGGGMIATYASIGPYPTGLAYDGRDLWHSDNIRDTIYRLDPTDLSVLDSFPSPGSYPNDLAWDGRYLWVVDNGTDQLYKYKVSGRFYTYLPVILNGH